ncbi:MAG: DNA topoisomerase [Treponema sp.]|nr:DNA topoisomerase [Treponema sp.]
MLILTEKPSVAKDFAAALNCSYCPSEKIYKSQDGKTIITNCVGHLYNLAEPAFYDSRFKSWKNLPILPDKFSYVVNPAAKDVEKNVIALLKKHKNNTILIATDADREGEIIARECLLKAGITDYSKIFRFWVSQALIPSVIIDGIKNAKPLSNYDKLAEEGFARQKADWLVGINVTRFITNKSGTLFPVGRVQTAVLSAIKDRCQEVKNFKKEKYYNYEAIFEIPETDIKVRGVYNENENSRFSDTSKLPEFYSLHGHKTKVLDVKKEQKEINPPLLYNLNDLQKDAFKVYGYSAEMTLSIIQNLYEKYKCVSYPRTPSRVMGEENVQLCSDLFMKFISECPEYFCLHTFGIVDGTNKRIFNDSKLEAHHAIIPLKKIPANATVEEEQIFFLILERFMLAFAPACKVEKTEIKLEIQGNNFEVKGQKVLEKGWKKFRRIEKESEPEEKTETEQELLDFDINNLHLNKVEALEKYTKPKKLFNEASILSFMENPKNEDGKKIAGLGTPATRHIFIPKLIKNNFIQMEGKNLLITSNGERLLEMLNETNFKTLANSGETRKWEEKLFENPAAFLEEITTFIKNGITEAS